MRNDCVDEEERTELFYEPTVLENGIEWEMEMEMEREITLSFHGHASLNRKAKGGNSASIEEFSGEARWDDATRKRRRT